MKPTTVTKNTATLRFMPLIGRTMKVHFTCIALACSLALPASAEDKPAQAPAEAAREESPGATTAMDLWVDMGLGLLGEEAFQEKGKKLKAGFKTTLEEETDAMKGDRHGIRVVTGKQFSDLVEKAGETSSFYSFARIGTTAGRAYLEASFHMTSEFSYVVVVGCPLKDLPAAARDAFLKMK